MYILFNFKHVWTMRTPYAIFCHRTGTLHS